MFYFRSNNYTGSFSRWSLDVVYSWCWLIGETPFSIRILKPDLLNVIALQWPMVLKYVKIMGRGALYNAAQCGIISEYFSFKTSSKKPLLRRWVFAKSGLHLRSLRSLHRARRLLPGMHPRGSDLHTCLEVLHWPPSRAQLNPGTLIGQVSYDRLIKHVLGSPLQWLFSLSVSGQTRWECSTNCLDLRTIHLALECFLRSSLSQACSRSQGHMAVVVAYIICQGGISP